MIITFLIVFICGFVVSLSAVPFADYLGKRYGIVSQYGGRRQNPGDEKQVSKLGGMAIFAGFMVATVVAQFLPVPRFDPYEVIRLMGLLIGGTFIFLVGILDDIFEFNALQLGIGQIITAGIAVLFQIFIEYFNNPLTGQQTDPWPPLVTVSISMFWLGLMMNTVNFMDGLDGLASGVAFIASTTLFVNSAFILEPAQTSVSLLPLALMGASLGFLVYNFYPAHLFMGGGAYFLGYVIGTLSIIGGAKMATILLVMGLPLMDLAWQATNRIRQGKNPMIGDRGHIHFRLLDMGFSHRGIVLGYYGFCSFFGILTLTTSSQLFKFLAFGVMMCFIAVGFLMLHYINQAGSSKSS